jgi:phosphohistidine phosphatase
MKHLLVIRHANAEYRSQGQSDTARPLSRRGEREARAAGEALLAGGPLPALIISSPALRTAATARIVASIVGLPENAIRLQDAVYNSTFPALLHVVAAFPDTADCIALVGHHPSVTDLVGGLAEPGSPAIGDMYTGCVVHIALDAPSWKLAVDTHGPAVRITG